MHELTVQRIPFSTDVDNRLRTMKHKTGITPNILCRIGFCLSLEEPGIPALLTENTQIGREINRYTLVGKYDILFVALLKTWFHMSELDFSEINDYFIAHMNQGANLICVRVKGVDDIAALAKKLI